MDYNQYDVDDFVADPFFCRWVQQPNEESHIFWEKWLEEHPEKADTVAQARSIAAFLNFSVEEASPQEQHEVKANIMRQIKASHHPTGRAFFFRRFWAVAAAVSLVLLGTYLVWQFAFVQPYQQYATHFGEQQEILLPDSTLVKLNANSRLKYKKGWSEGHMREVWLEGEGFFEVVKKPDAADGRFIVHTPQLDVEVLGTTFNVQTRNGATQVVLNTGKVKLQQAGIGKEQEVFLEPGEMATLSQDQLIKTQVNPQIYSSWKDNRLFFENESIRSIAQRLKDMYGYEIRVDQQEWLDLKFTGSCPADDISILLMAISESFDLKVTLNQQQIHIKQHE